VGGLKGTLNHEGHEEHEDFEELSTRGIGCVVEVQQVSQGRRH
jgi:hypothetical protein